MEETKTYRMNMHCRNCRHTFVKKFDYGCNCEGAVVCPECGCREAIAVGAYKSGGRLSQSLKIGYEKL